MTRAYDTQRNMDPAEIQVGDVLVIYEPATDIRRRMTSCAKVLFVSDVDIVGERLNVIDLRPIGAPSASWPREWLATCVVKLLRRVDIPEPDPDPAP